jgi:hypothetical protein
LNVNLVGEGKVSFEQPGGEVAESSQGKFIYGIVIKNIIQGPENIKGDYDDAEGDDKRIFVIKMKEAEKVLVPAGIDCIGV